MHDLDQRADTVGARVGAGNCHRAPIDVARNHAAAQRLGGRDGKYARAGADVEDACPPSALAKAALEQCIEREQAAARGAVMTGAEGKRRLDLDADAVGRHA